MLETISKIIRSKREEMGLTIAQLAERANVSDSYISRIERGEIDNARIKKLDSIAKALNLKIADFFVNSDLSDIYSLELVKYLQSLSYEKRKELSQAILKIISISK